MTTAQGNEAAEPGRNGISASEQPTAVGAYKNVTVTAYNEDLELKGGKGFEAAKVYMHIDKIHAEFAG